MIRLIIFVGIVAAITAVVFSFFFYRTNYLRRMFMANEQYTHKVQDKKATNYENRMKNKE